MSNKKEIVYLNQAEATPPETNDGKWTIDQLTVNKPPTKCKITINDRIVIDDVYIWENTKDGGYSVYNNYLIQRFGFCTSEQENCWAVFRGEGLVLEFKAENYKIEYYEP